MENTLQYYRRTTIFKRPPRFTIHIHFESYYVFWDVTPWCSKSTDVLVSLLRRWQSSQSELWKP